MTKLNNSARPRDPSGSAEPRAARQAQSPFVDWQPASLLRDQVAPQIPARPPESAVARPANEDPFTAAAPASATLPSATPPSASSSAPDAQPVDYAPLPVCPASAPSDASAAPANRAEPAAAASELLAPAMPAGSAVLEPASQANGAPPEAPASESPAPSASAGGGKMGERLVSAGLLTPEQVQRTIELQQQSGLRFGEAAIRLGFVTERDMQNALSEQFNYATALMAHPTLHTSLAIAHNPFGREAEAIRQIRAEISLRLNSRKHFSLAVVSPNDGDGKSYVAASLAVAYSQSGQRVLLINADLRGGAGSELFKLKGGAGLSTMLAGREAHAPGQSVPGFPLLHVLSCGPTPPNPTEILGAPALQRFIDRFRDDFDVIVVDTPAANRSADAQIIASQTDVCMLVVRQDATLMADLRQTQERMRRAGAQLVGSVYNSYGSPQAGSARTSWWARWLRRR
ncbi:polysaccharide biosynthesis tyrosine autokinase [Bordetella genomosp. 13]|uniref:polysaccharide biosynthesis tyrosine autokinase n=1 Tax=Bordetella genomosp. 13 TaxID=463040 RepID=UPI0011A4FBCB|nr:polysaccharide biosynthesis tyrosine autokinase [Bordetella genomosp. 13]